MQNMHAFVATFSLLERFQRPPLGQGGVLDLGLFEKSNGPPQGGVLDLGLSGGSKPPPQGGVLDLGLSKIARPGARGGGVTK